MPGELEGRPPPAIVAQFGKLVCFGISKEEGMIPGYRSKTRVYREHTGDVL